MVQLAGRFRKLSNRADCAPDKQVLCFAAKCCKVLHMDKELSPPTKPPRVSVPVTEEVLLVFQRLAKAGNMSTGRAIAEWLGDTVEAAEYMASTMERARLLRRWSCVRCMPMRWGWLMRQGTCSARSQKKGRATAQVGEQESRTLARTVSPSCNTGVNYLKTQENHIRGPSDRSENIYRLVPVQDASKPFRGL